MDMPAFLPQMTFEVTRIFISTIVEYHESLNATRKGYFPLYLHSFVMSATFA